MTQKYVNDIAYEIVGCAIEVHKELGPGLLESIYEKCLVEELLAQGFKVESQSLVLLKYKGKDLGFNLKMDIVVEDLIVVELKSVESILPVFKAQLLTYLNLANKPKGLLINFNSENITKDGLVPLVTKAFSNLPK
ncbi:MAG: GxxExxY protein [Bacteroidia bacterium]|nr:GxxExxY protein [Bacteroidia bacterium]